MGAEAAQTRHPSDRTATSQPLSETGALAVMEQRQGQAFLQGAERIAYPRSNPIAFQDWLVDSTATIVHADHRYIAVRNDDRRSFGPTHFGRVIDSRWFFDFQAGL